MGKFWKSMVFLITGKMFGMTSPFILKWVVNTMTAAVSLGPGGSVAMTMSYAMLPVSLTACIGAVGMWGVAKLSSLTLLCYQMDSITGVIQDGIKRIANQSFRHLHTLDLNYHKQSSKNTVFGINRALRSID
jgi:hypothetical protein